MNKIHFFITFIALVFIFVCFTGCRNGQKQKIETNDGVKTILIPEVVDAKSADIIYDLDYIILEAKENSYFGNVSKMRVHRDRIFILDTRHAKALFIYTMEGKHIATVGDKKGRGPLEFLSVTNFDIDYVNNQLAVLDNSGRKFMIYDLDGNFVKQVVSDITVFDAVLLPNGYIVHAKPTWEYKIPGQSNCQIIIVGENKQIVKEGFEYDDNKNINIHIYDIISAQLDGGVNFAPKFRDTIYSVSVESITPKYALNYGNNRKIPKSMIDEFRSTDELYELLKDGNTCFMGNHVESKDFLYLSLGRFHYSIFVFYDKQTNNTIAIANKAKIDDYEFELYTVLCSDSKEYFYGAFNFTDMDKVIKLFPEMQKLEVTEDMNPILFRYKVKI